MIETQFYPRLAEPSLLEALEYSPVVLVHGPRQCGKTALAKTTCTETPHPHQPALKPGLQSAVGENAVKGYEYINFDDDISYETAKNDPVGFVADLPDRVILDEIQRLPRLFSTIKMEVDQRRTPGRFVLIGSANVLLMPRLPDSLAGRMQIVRLHPLAQCELGGQLSPGFIKALFEGRFKIRRAQRLGNQISERIVSGGYPAAFSRPPGERRADWHKDCVCAQLRRDARNLARISMPDVLPRLLTFAAAQTASLFNLSGLASPFRLSRPTIGSYVKLLEMLFLVDRVPPWCSSRQSRLVRTPKLHIGDTGLACSLLGLNADSLVSDRTLLGRLLETFVFQEMRKQADRHNSNMSFCHYRDRDGAEVDIVIERGALAVTGVHVKASSTVNNADFRGLRRLKEAAGDRFAGGAVLYDGMTSARFGDKLYAVPLRFLWEND